MRNRFASLCLLLSASACAAIESEEDEAAFGTTEQPVQRSYFLADYFSIVDRAQLPAARRRVFDAVGAARVRIPDGTHGSCGVTFVSPHFAITAAHCVNWYRPGLDQFSVEQVRLSNFSLGAVNQASVIVGDRWSDWSQPNPLDRQDGYEVVTYGGCKLRRNCSAEFPPQHDCPGNRAFPTWNADMALIECPARPASASWVTAAGNRAEPLDGKGVEIWWFHEFLSMPIGPLFDGAPEAQRERWEHYGYYNGNRTQNYHYARKHQLLPLLSSTWPSGARYRATGSSGRFPIPEYSLIDTPVCHGTSGSGVFVAGTDQYLGPVVRGVGTIADDRLCAAMDQERPGAGISFVTKPFYAALMQEANEVVADRLGVYP